MVQNKPKKKKKTRQKLRSIFHVHKLNTLADNITKTWDDNDPQTRWTWGHFQQDGQGYNRPPLASPRPPVIQSFAVDYTAPLSTYPFNPAMRGTQRGDTSNVAQLFFMRRKLSGPKPKGTGLGKDKRDTRSVAMRLGCGGKWCHFSVHRQRSFFCLPLKNLTMQNVCKRSAEMCEQTYWGPNVHNDFRIFIMKKFNYFNTNG